MRRTLPEVATGAGVALVLLVLLRFAADLDGGGLDTWSLLVEVVVGGLAGSAAVLARRRVAVAVTAGLLLAWPSLAAIVGLLPGPPRSLAIIGPVWTAGGIVLVLAGVAFAGAIRR